MAESSEFWKAWAPYLSYFEENALDLDTINQLIPTIKAPVLVVGAGQGLLVEELQKQGITTTGIDYEPLMIDYAKKRRGLDLILADATDLPDKDNIYQTTIIATGVVDFMEDENTIESIITEAKRVTSKSGTVLVAFYRMPRKVERLFMHIGFITEDGHGRYRLFCRLPRMNLIEILKAFKEETGSGYLKTFFTLMRIQLASPREQNVRRKRIQQMWKQISKDVDDPDALVRAAPELIPFRDDENIHALFDRVNVSVSNVMNFDSCTIVQL